MRRLDLKFATALVIVVSAMAVCLSLAHEVQMRRQTPALLETVRRAEAEGDPGRAEKLLALYLNLRREDGRAWAWYARLIDGMKAGRRGQERVYLIYAEAMRHAPDDPKLARRLAELALELGRYSDAQTNLERVLALAEEGAGDRSVPELEEMLGQCHRGQARFDEAQRSFRRAIERDSSRISAYVHLARLLRGDLRRSEDADAAIRAMVEKNPGSAVALISRWRYRQEFAPPGDPADIGRALEWAPSDPEVRLAAAVAAEQAGDVASARQHWEKGWALAPGHAELAVGLARAEARDGHLERAEAVLRRACQANDSAALAFELADVLILRGRISGEGQVEEQLARLGAAGFGETLLRFLEAEALVQEARWAEAIARIERDRAVLRPYPRLVERLEWMLAECYGRMGADELRLGALRRAADDRGPESARLELARTLAGSGRADEAVSLLALSSTRSPSHRLELIRSLIERTSRLPEGRRDWRQAEEQLREAARSLGENAEPLTLLRATMLAARGRPDQARSLLAKAQAGDTGNVRYRLAQARLAQQQGRDDEALGIIDQAERDLGPGVEVRMARLDFWGRAGGDPAIAAVARLAASAAELPAVDRPAFLDRLAAVEAGLGRLPAAREHLRQLSASRPDDVRVLARRMDLAVQAGDHDEALELVARLRAIEGERGTYWRFGRAEVLLDRARKGTSRDLAEPGMLAGEVAGIRPDWWGGPILSAEVAELEGRTDEAIKAYTRAIELGNNDPALARRLAGLLDQKEGPDAIERVAGILTDRGKSASDLRIAAALDAIRRGDLDRALALARRGIPEDSPGFADHLILGRFYQAARRFEEAERELQLACERGPGVPAAWLAYVQHLVLTHRVDRARAAADAASRALAGGRSELAVARCFAMVGDAARAEARMQAALESPARDASTIRAAVELCIDQGRFDRVGPIRDRRRDPGIPAAPEVMAWANRARGLALLSTGRPTDSDRALGLVEQNLEAAPSSREDLRLKGVILAVLPGRRGEAIRVLDALDRSGRLGPGDRFLLAQACLTEGQADRYRGLIDELAKAEPDDPRYPAHLAGFLVDRGQLAEAARRLDEASARSPSAAAVLRPKLGAIYCRQGRYDEAEALLRRVLRDDPGNVEALNNLAWEMALREPGKPREALELIDRAIRRSGPVPAFLDTRAVALIRAGQLDRAMQELSAAQSSDPRNASLALHLAWAYQSAGRADEARRSFRQAQALGLRPEARHPLERGLIDRLQRQMEEGPST